MKKNKMMRLASILLVCVLLTTSVISGTFAKYVTTDSASDTARVAKWGIDVQVGGNLFGKDYSAKTTEGGNVICAATSASVSATDANLVAPGTKNSDGFTVKLTGTPEVAYKVTAKTGTDIANNTAINEDIFLGVGTWGVMVRATGLQKDASLVGYYYYDESDKLYKSVNGTYSGSGAYFELHDAVTVTEAYYPINWTVTAEGRAKAVTSDAASKKNLVDIANKMVANIVADAAANDKESDFFKANTNADTKYVLTWEWPFEVGSAVTTSGYDIYETDKMDTILGNLMAPSEGVVVKLDGVNYKVPTEQNGTTLNDYNLDIVFNFEVAVEQVD